ncbi:3-oxoacyl-[acyl-carrier-protein] synthase 2 [compost metagenome]
MSNSNLNHQHMPRAVVTGIGVQCAFANNYEQFKAELQQTTQTRQQLRVISVESLERTTQMDHDKIRTKTLIDFNEYGLDSLKEAMKNASISVEHLAEIKHQVGLVYATSTEDTNTFLYRTFSGEDSLFGEKFSQYVQKSIPINGKITVCDSSCSAGGIAAGTALDLIKYNDHKVVLLGGIETITLMQHSGFSSLGALGSIGSQPFSDHRDGVGLGNASVFLIIEEYEYAINRGATILGELLGYGISNDAYHITAPHPEGLGAKLAMQRAMKEAGVTSEQISYINGHGTGTSTNDSMELLAIEETFKGSQSPVYVSSIKSLTGHTLSAAGVIELAATISALHEQYMIPNFELDHPMEHSEFIVLPTEAVPMEYSYALSNSFAFGGNCVSVVVKKLAEEVL